MQYSLLYPHPDRGVNVTRVNEDEVLITAVDFRGKRVGFFSVTSEGLEEGLEERVQAWLARAESRIVRGVTKGQRRRGLTLVCDAASTVSA